MKARTRRRPRKTASKEKLAIALTISIIAIIIIGAIILQQIKNEANTPKKNPNEYFQFVNASALAIRVSQNIIRIKTLSFILKPIGGDAHHVVIFAQGMANPKDYYYIEIKNNTEQPIEIQFPSLLQVTKQDNAYPLALRIWSDEAEGQVIIWLKEEDILPLP